MSASLEHDALRIAVVTPASVGYSETFIRAHISGLRGHIHVLNGDEVATLQDGKPIIPTIVRAAVKGRRYFPEFAGRIGQAYATKRVVRYLQRKSIDVVLAEYGWTGVMIRRACVEASIPLVVHFHGVDAYSNFGPPAKYEGIFRDAKAIVAVSRAMVDKLKSLGCSADKLFYNSCGVEVEKFTTAERRSAGPVFLSVGRFVEKKAPQLTLLAFAKVAAVYPESRLIMAGDGPLREACMQIAQALHLSGVTFPGPLGPEEVLPLMRSARVFLQHSVTALSGDSEGTPVVILEAAACALPVISTRHGGIVDAVVNGETGYLVDEGDVDGMAHYMLRLAEDGELAERLGIKGREHVSQHYAMSARIAELNTILRNAAAKSTYAGSVVASTSKDSLTTPSI